MLHKGQTNSGSFIKGQYRTYQKTCSDCFINFIAKSGNVKKCDNCFGVCGWCAKPISGKNRIWRKFCNNSCSGKWKHKNYESVRTIGMNRLSINRGIGISKARLGKKRDDLRGERNSNWKGGTYGTERSRLMAKVEYKNWRRNVFLRDDFTCQMCNERGGILNADHIVPYYVDKSRALDLSNGRTLCYSCHKKTDTWGHKVKKLKK